MSAGGTLTLKNPEHSVCDAQVGVCGNHIDVIGLHARSLPDFGHGHLGCFRKQFREDTFVLGLQVLHQNKGHPGVQRQSRQKFREGFQSAGRCSDAYDREGPFARLREASCADGSRGGSSTASCRRISFYARSFRRFWRRTLHRLSPPRTAYRLRIPTAQTFLQRLPCLRGNLSHTQKVCGSRYS